MIEYARPRGLPEALSLLSGPDAHVLCGGTDLIVGLSKGTLHPRLVVDIKQIAELQPGIALSDGRLRIAATTTLSTVIADERVRSAFPALVEAAQVVGSIQIRNRASLAGNLCNASPAADTAPPLLVYGAVLEIVGAAGSRRVPITDFFTGPGRTVLGPGELLGAIELPMPDRPRGSAFARMTRRRGVDLATVNLCSLVSADGPVRFGYGAVGPTPLLVTDESGVLADPGADEAAVDTVLRRLVGQATPISNVRASREYREAMLLVLSRRALAEAHRRLREAAHAG